jgi:hypothetical protein
MISVEEGFEVFLQTPIDISIQKVVHAYQSRKGRDSTSPQKNKFD